MRGMGGSSESESEWPDSLRAKMWAQADDDDDALEGDELDGEFDESELEDDEFDDEFDDELDDDLIDLDDEYDTTGEEDRHAPGPPPRRYEE